MTKLHILKVILKIIDQPLLLSEIVPSDVTKFLLQDKYSGIKRMNQSLYFYLTLTFTQSYHTFRNIV